MPDYTRHDWLALRAEDAIDPHRLIIDPHHHLWQRATDRYLAQELTDDATASHNITHTVFVECSSNYDTAASPAFAPVGETRFVRNQAAESARLGGPEIAAIVSHADLTLGAQVAEVLSAHDEAGAGRFRGVRHGTNWSKHAEVKNGHHEPGPQLLADPAFREGLSTLSAMGFSFDAWLYFDQLSELAEVARAVPECTIVLDHLGGPLGIGPHAQHRNEMLQVWRAGIEEVAGCANVMLKVGGVGMEHYFGTTWSSQPTPPSSEQVASHWHDLVIYAIDTFGPTRCMFESNFPVDRQTLPYGVLWNSFQILATSYSQAEQDALFALTAARTYQI